MQATPQDSTTHVPTTAPALYLAFELGGSHFKLAFAVEPAGTIRKRSLKTCNARELLGLLAREIALAKARFGLPAHATVLSVYEAGREAFWLDRALKAMGVENVIIDPASLPVNRKARRAKTDRLDLLELISSLFRHHRGERVWRVVTVPGVADEDIRRLSRRRERLVKEQTQHVNRIKGLLNQEGIKLERGLPRRFEQELEGYRRFDGSRLGEQLQADLRDEVARLRVVQAQIKTLNDEQKALLRQEAPTSATVRNAQRLATLKGVGPVSAIVLSAEFFGWRDFKNRRQVGALAGLTDSHWKSDGIDRQQGISKAGNRRVRSTAIELAWGWLRHQPQSALSQWFKQNAGNGKKRLRRIAIVGLARKLLVAFWHYLDHGLVPEDAILKA